MNQSISKILEFLENSPVKTYADFTITEAEEGRFGAKIQLLSYFKRYDGVAHGGFISYLADSLMGFASLTLLDENHTIYTADIKVSFLKPGFGEYLSGLATVIRAGQTIHFCEAEIYGQHPNGDPYLCAKASATMVVSKKHEA